MADQPPLSRLAFDPEGRVLHGPALKIWSSEIFRARDALPRQ